MPNKRQKRIIVIGGGTGVFTVLSGLKSSEHRLAAIVTMADDGGSTGVLREEFGILPPGDIRRALVALSGAEKSLADLFAYRFEEGRGLEGHSVGNLLLTALERMTGSFERAIEEASKILQISGDVIPVTLNKVRLKAWLEGGGVLFGEHKIDVPIRRRIARIMRVTLTPGAKANPRALRAIAEADLVVMGPGDLYTSLLPNLAVRGIPGALKKTRAKKVMVVNLMTKRGETDGFTTKDFVEAVEKKLGKNTLDAIIVNTGRPGGTLLKWYYENEKAQPVAWSQEMVKGKKLRVVTGNFLRSEGQLIRHDPKKLAKALLNLL